MQSECCFRLYDTMISAMHGISSTYSNMPFAYTSTRSSSLARAVPFLAHATSCVVPRLSTLVSSSEDKISFDWLLHCHLRRKKNGLLGVNSNPSSESSNESNNNSCYRLRTRTWMFHVTSYVVQNQI